MRRIALLSDTHGWLDPRIAQYAESCDEFWHAGDIGREAVADALAAILPLRAVFGNIDGPELRRRYPEELAFTLEGVRVCMTHIGGRPGRYPKAARALIRRETPDLFICGHSHILRVMYDRTLGLLYLNPGATGRQGFHAVRTMLRFYLAAGEVSGMEVIELGPRGG